jgi:hypothetical protein
MSQEPLNVQDTQVSQNDNPNDRADPPITLATFVTCIVCNQQLPITDTKHQCSGQRDSDIIIS